MSVIINELEVAVQPPPPEPTVGATPEGRAAAPTPLELRDMVRHIGERLDRVQAD